MEVAFAGRGHEGAQRLETIGRDQAARDKVPESAFGVGGKSS
jgi:hypothetical protein